MSKMGKEHTHTFLYRVCDMSKMSETSFTFSLNVILSTSKIGQIHLRAIMPHMSKMSKIKKKHTYTFLLITSLIFNGFSIPKKFWKAETEGFSTIPSNPMYVKACRRCRKALSLSFSKLFAD